MPTKAPDKETKKVEVTLQAAWPHTKKQLRQFLGLVGYYSCFTPDFATQTAPLTNCFGKPWSGIPWPYPPLTTSAHAGLTVHAGQP